MKRFLAVAVLAVAAWPADGQEKQAPQAKMLAWEWVGDSADGKGHTYRKFRAVCDGTINPTQTTEVARAFSDQVTRHEKYTMLGFAQGGLPTMSAWAKNKDKTFTREYVFKTGGRKADAAVPKAGGTGTTDTAKEGVGHLKSVMRGTETGVDAIKFKGPKADGGGEAPGQRTTYSLTYTSPPSDAQVQIDGDWLTKMEGTYKWALHGGESRKSPWKTIPGVKWETTSADKCTVEVVCELVRIERTP